MRVLRTWDVGSHQAFLEENDVIRICFEGPMTFEDARKVLQIYAEVCSERPHYLLADIGRSSLDPATRKYLGRELRHEWFFGVVYVGANLFLRTITDALLALVPAGRGPKFQVRYVATEEEGRAIIERWREAREA